MPIMIKKSHQGRFTAFARAHGVPVQTMASRVLANKGNYSAARVKQAVFAKNAKSFRH